jgi:hypothetical protein
LKQENIRKLMGEVSVIEEETDVDFLKVMAVTWNLQGGCPSLQNLDQLF